MPFVPAQIEIKPASVGTGIKVGLRKLKNSTAARMTMYISARTATELQIADGDKIEVMLGEGEHHGLIRLRKNNSAGQAPVSKTGSGKVETFRLSLGCQRQFVVRTEPTQWCQWEAVEEGWFEVVLPKWADETAPGRTIHKAPAYPAEAQRQAQTSREPYKSPAIEAARIEKRGPGRPAKQNVTAALMGDPPPNRREMLAKIGSMKP